jgi:hypothetical protein
MRRLEGVLDGAWLVVGFRHAFDVLAMAVATTSLPSTCELSDTAEPGASSEAVDSRLAFPVVQKHRSYFLGYRDTVSLGASELQGTPAADRCFSTMLGMKRLWTETVMTIP